MSSAAKIPVIDISAAGEEAQAKVAKELVDAAVEHGFVYIKNEGADIPVESVENAFELVRAASLNMFLDLSWVVAESSVCTKYRAGRSSQRPWRKSRNVPYKRITAVGQV